MYFNPTEKAKAVLRDWHQVCVEGGSNQPAWNKVRPPSQPTLHVHTCPPEALRVHEPMCKSRRVSVSAARLAAQVFNTDRRNSMDYHVMTKELYPHGYLLETRGFFANDRTVSLHLSLPNR